MKTLSDLKVGLSPESLARIDEKVSEMRLESQLYKLREALDRTQREQAALCAMHVVN
ncbi:hypothetical protein SC171_21115 [Pantoea cypripedii]|uniref:hypothetical protein n=1 Tax=Pantoea cypripedii TaxID=55209 RepID=UPI002FC907CF